MATSCLLMVIFCIFVTFNNIHHVQASDSPNVLLIMMDDLGFTDTSINGGIFPTSTLDELSLHGIKLNYHYANTLCSASRSSLLTGRYAWRTGVINLVKPLTSQRTNENIPFISSILKNSKSKYVTSMFGKYHLGYSSLNYLPFNRGFDTTLFYSSGAIGYTSHQDCIPWYWALKDINNDINDNTLQLLNNKFIDGFCSYDLWDEHYNKIQNNIYSEKLFTDNIIDYIQNYKKSESDIINPFFIYYAMQTPHWPLEDPPKSYKECNDIDHDRKIFCNALLYADEMISDIIHTLKSNNLYDNTVIIFLSDNGPNTNWKNKGYGQTLPLRGAKGTTFEGGIRTPAIVSGGYVENNCKSENIGNSYDNIVHISDWFSIIKHIANVDTINDDDLDIDGINLWPSICYNSNSDEHLRDNIIHISMNNDNDVTGKEGGFGPSYIRTNTWKLTINASLRTDGNDAYKYWVDYDNSVSMKPPTKIYNNIDGNGNGLYSSSCFDTYIDSVDEDVAEIDFRYSDIMLFRILSDKIEACNVARYYPKIVSKLMKRLISQNNINEYITYQIYPSTISKQGALTQIQSYDCNKNKLYHLSWENDENDNNIDTSSHMSWDNIFNEYIDIVDKCNTKGKYAINHQQIILILCGSIIISIVMILRENYRKNNLNEKLNNNVSDITPLLPAI